MAKTKIAVLVSGGGTNLQALIDAQQQGMFGEGKITAVISSKAGAYALERAAKANIPGYVLPRKEFASNQAMTVALVEMLRKMKENYDLYMLSNNNGITMVRAYEIFAEAGAPIDETFKKSFLSHEMKMLKPSAAFYQEVIRQIGIPAEDMLFIDDSVHNVEGSIAAGLPAVHYVPGTDLSALLADALGDPSLKMEV